MSKYFPGHPGGPGRPKTSAWVKHLAAKCTEEAITEIAAIARDPDVSAKTRLDAWNSLLDRAHGKPAQEVTANVNVNETSQEDVAARAAAILAGAVIETDTDPVGEPH